MFNSFSDKCRYLYNKFTLANNAIAAWMDFTSGFSTEKFTFQEVLEKAKILGEKDKPIDIFPLENSITEIIQLPPWENTFLYTSSNDYSSKPQDYFGLKLIPKGSSDADTFVDEFISFKEGNMSFSIRSIHEREAYKDYRGREVASLPLMADLYNYSFSESIVKDAQIGFINLPLFFYNIIFNERFHNGEGVVVLEKFFDKNNGNTAANVFNYVRTHESETFQIVQSIEKILNNLAENEILKNLEEYKKVSLVGNITCHEIKVFGKSIAYYSFVKNGKLYIYQDPPLVKDSLEEENKYDDFPSIIILEKDKITFRFSPKDVKLKHSSRFDKFFGKEETIEDFLLSTDQKAEELFAQKYSNNLPSLFKKLMISFIKYGLIIKEKNIISQLRRKIKNSYPPDYLFKNYIKYIDTMKGNILENRENFDILLKTLANIYSKEILMNKL